MPRHRLSGSLIASLLMLSSIGAACASDGTYLKTTIHYEYDEVGNVTAIHDEGNADDSSDDVHAEIRYSAADATCQSRHILGKATEMVVRDGQNKVVRHRKGTIDCGDEFKGSLTALTQYLGSGTITNTLDYDDYGNLTSVIGPADERSEQTSVLIGYDATLNTYPVSVTNHFIISLKKGGSVLG